MWERKGPTGLDEAIPEQVSTPELLLASGSLSCQEGPECRDSKCFAECLLQGTGGGGEGGAPVDGTSPDPCLGPLSPP